MACIERRTITIEATPGAQSGEIDWRMISNGSPVPNEVISCSKSGTMKKDTDHHEVTFELKPSHGLKLSFLKDPDNVMWVQPGTNCPKNPAADRDFEIESVTDDRLVVRNYNRRKCDHKFTLNFLGKSPGESDTRLIQYDPGWGNGNGGV
jgi:hypothetical protein